MIKATKQLPLVVRENRKVTVAVNNMLTKTPKERLAPEVFLRRINANLFCAAQAILPFLFLVIGPLESRKNRIRTRRTKV